MNKITKVKALKDYRLQLTFAGGTTGTVDLSDLVGKGVFALWKDYAAFEDVRIGPGGELCWGEQIDLCPDSMYLKVTGKQPPDIFGKLKRGPVHA